jgi:hypothetical protein
VEPRTEFWVIGLGKNNQMGKEAYRCPMIHFPSAESGNDPRQELVQSIVIVSCKCAQFFPLHKSAWTQAVATGKLFISTR